MSRHSHWAKIKRGKGASDVTRGKTFSKLARLVSVAAREGGGDPAFNFKLRLAVDRAKAASMPKDAIDRAIARGAGTGADAAVYTIAMYEGFAPGGAAVLVEVLTDNTNRALNEVKAVFTKRGGTLGNEGSVRWMFAPRGSVRVVAPSSQLPAASTEDIELKLIDAGASDIERDADGTTIACAVTDLQRVKEAVEKAGLTVEDAVLEWAAKQHAEIPADAQEQFDAFVAALEELDDVQEVYTNAG